MRRKILIVDDLTLNRQILSNMLCLDYDIFEAASGKEALDFLSHNYKKISAVLLDIVMPGIDGYEVLRQMKTAPVLAQIPVIMITGSGDEAGRIKALSLGANDFVMKPYNPDIIRHCLRNNIALSETVSIVNALQKDKLTGLYSRETFFEKVTEMIQEHEPGYYIMSCFDIDNFKLINDQYGVAEGNRILQEIGTAAQKEMSLISGIAGRISADNFAALFPAQHEESSIIRIAQTNRKAFSNQQSIVFSVGRYIIADLALSASAIYDRAYIAKQSIKGRYNEHIAYFDETMLDKLIRNQQIIADMDLALAEHQFEVWFQPQYNHSTGALMGAEALVRWRHPHKGLIPPGEFIPLFERNGFVYELDKYVWEKTCQYLRKWADEGNSPLPVSVNVSRYDIFCTDFVDVITGLIEKYDIPVDLLRLEITESAFAKSTTQIVQVVKKLISHGFTIEIDDFGSGYSSLNTLKNVPAQVIKLDMRFLEGDDDSQRGGNILESIVRMAKWLGISVIAEGVEEKQQADFLKTIGCSYVQGFLYARPMPVEDYEAHCKGISKEEGLLTLETIENLDTNAFWDPKSMDTLIFNSYVGGACIYEYHDGRIELLRATEKYAQVIGSAGMTVEDALKLDWSKHIDQKSGREVIDALEASIRTKDEVTGEYLFLDLPGCPHETYLRSSMRVIAHAGSHYLVYCTNENITAQRQAEQKERAAAAQLAAIMNNINSGVTAVNIADDGTIHYYFSNEKYYAMQGYTLEQFAEEVKDAFALVYPDDRIQVKTWVAGLIKEGGSGSCDYRIIKRNQEIISVRSTSSVTTIEGIGSNVLLSVMTDISELVKAEKYASSMAMQLKIIMDNINGGVTATILKDEAPSLLFANDQFYKQQGYTREQYYEEVNHPHDPIHPQDRARVTAQTLEASRSGKPFSAVYRIIRRDGSIRWLQNNISITTIPGVDEIVQLAVANDVTEQREAEQAVYRVSEQLQQVLENVNCGITAVTFEGEKITYLLTNNRYYQLLGYTKEQYLSEIGSNAFKTIHPEDRQRITATVEQVSISSRPAQLEYRALRRDGSVVWLRSDVSMTSFDGVENPVQLSTYTDFTSEKYASQELLDNLPCGAILCDYHDNELTIIHLNRRFKEIIGREFDEGVYASAFESVHPDDIMMLQNEMKSAMAAHSDLACDLRLLHGSGDYLYFHLNARGIERNDSTWAAYVTFMPISDEAMSIQEMLPIALEAMMASQTDFAFVKDKNLRYVCCSSAFARMAGLDSEKDVVGKSDYDLFEPAFAKGYVAADKHLLASGKSLLDYTENIPSPDSAVHYAITSKYLLHDSRGNIVGLYGISRDITQAREAESQLKLLTDSIPGGLATYECTPSGIALTYFNEGYCNMFGFTYDEYAQISANDPLAGVSEADVPLLLQHLDALKNDNNTPIDCIYTAWVKSGEHRQFNLKAAASDQHGDTLTVNAVLFDVTEQQEALERLRISEEENRLATLHSGNTVCRYNIADKSVTVPARVNSAFLLHNKVENIPYGPVENGDISPETSDAYINFFESILAGQKSGVAVYQRNSAQGWRWLEAHFSTIFSNAGKPTSAVLSLTDVTEQIEKESVYKRWQQSLQSNDPNSFTLFRSNISKNTPFDTMAGELLHLDLSNADLTFDQWTLAFAEQCVFEEDKSRYLAFLDSDTLLVNYYRGKRVDKLEFMEKLPDGSLRWLRLTVELVEYPNSTDVEAYMMYENIDDSKRAELLVMERAKNDPLTGLLNRIAFKTHVEHLIHTAMPYNQHALLMLDIDGFKLVNDIFGHAVGDQALIDIADTLRPALHRNDLFGRLGGDEFVIFLSDIPSNTVVADKAKQICTLTRKSFGIEVEISGSIGIAMYPRDGTDFGTLYKKADAALYHVKASGKDSYAFYHNDIDNDQLELDENIAVSYHSHILKKRRRMLIVAGNEVAFDVLANVFADEFIVEKAKDSRSALIRLRHYGSVIAVVLLDLIMPGLDGFTLLEKMQQSSELRSIPVIVVSQAINRELSLRAIKSGASDFITKPVDPDMLRIRVDSVISKASNERLRAKNSLIEYQNSAVLRYKTVLERSGVVVIEHDWVAGTFHYDSYISEHFAGVYDHRKLWHILLADMVADTWMVKKMQEFVYSLAEDKTRQEDSITVTLKTPSQDKCNFRMKIYKLVNEFQLTDKLLLVFNKLTE